MLHFGHGFLIIIIYTNLKSENYVDKIKATLYLCFHTIQASPLHTDPSGSVSLIHLIESIPRTDEEAPPPCLLPSFE